MSIDISQFKAFAGNIGIPVIAKNYEEQALLFPLFCDVRPPDSASTPHYGDISTTLHFGTTPVRRPDGAPIQRTTGGEGYQPQIAIHEDALSLGIPKRMMDSVSGREQAGGLIANFVGQFSRNARVKKDKFVFSLLQRGAITAGDTAYFDNTYVGRKDPNPGKIYDGVSFFNNAHPLAFSSTTVDNYVTDTLNATNLDSAIVRASYTNALDESGNQISTPPSFLIVPTALRSTGQVLLGSDQLPGTGNNDLNYNRNALTLIVTPYITTATAWAVGSRDTIRVFDSGAPAFDTWEDKEKGEMVVGLSYRFGAGIVDWRGWVGSNFPTS